MLNSIRLQNFRSLQDSGWVNLPRLTVLVGSNGSGKSTLLRTFPLLRQSVQTTTRSPVLWFGRYVDFGSLASVRTSGHENSPVIMSFDVSLPASNNLSSAEYRFRSYIAGQAPRVKIDIHLVEGPEKNKAKTIVSKMVLELSTGDSVVLELRPDGDIDRFSIESPRAEELDLLKLGIKLTRNHRSALIPTFRFEDESSVHSMMGAMERKYRKEPVYDFEISAFHDVIILTDQSRTAIDTEIWASLEMLGLDALVLPQSEAYELLDNLPVTSADNFLASLQGAREHVAFRLALANLDPHDSRVDYARRLVIAKYVPAMLASLDYAISTEMSQTKYLGPLRAHTSRYYRVQELDVTEIDHVGENMAMVLASLSAKQLSNFSRFLKQTLKVGLSVENNPGHVSIYLTEKGRTVNIADTGFGYSQVLPLALQLWLNSDQAQRSATFIAIEQPELHLHPQLQATVASILAAALGKSSTTKILVETHSDVFINHIGELVSKGQLNEEHVQILIFDREKGSTTVKRAYYDKEGVLMDWPFGFFLPYQGASSVL